MTADRYYNGDTKADRPYCRTCKGRHTPEPDLTPDQREARRQGKLDAFCTACGHAAAATGWCYQGCHRWLPDDVPRGHLVYVTHAEQADWPGSLLCGAPNRFGTRPGRPVPRAGTAATTERASGHPEAVQPALWGDER